mmetsp:Transcript_16361/g.38458  ORF Transcript_16361/g.38458 Transcript_16361/m.38458 type:complete len:287 (+) Transcript_16361:736-1596(+)
MGSWVIGQHKWFGASAGAGGEPTPSLHGRTIQSSSSSTEPSNGGNCGSSQNTDESIDNMRALAVRTGGSLRFGGVMQGPCPLVHRGDGTILSQLRQLSVLLRNEAVPSPPQDVSPSPPPVTVLTGDSGVRGDAIAAARALNAETAPAIMPVRGPAPVLAGPTPALATEPALESAPSPPPMSPRLATSAEPLPPSTSGPLSHRETFSGAAGAVADADADTDAAAAAAAAAACNVKAEEPDSVPHPGAGQGAEADSVRHAGGVVQGADSVRHPDAVQGAAGAAPRELS